MGIDIVWFCTLVAVCLQTAWLSPPVALSAYFLKGVGMDCVEYAARCPEEIETTLFRVVQEGLANVHRHSGSTSASVQLVRSGDNIELTIADRGRGLPAGLQLDTAEETRVGVGIAGMRQRVRQLGGRLKITSGPDGATVRAVLPFRANDAGIDGNSK